MFSTDDTIVAIATPPGRAGIGVVRVSGADATQVAAALLDGPDALEPRHVTVASLVEPVDGGYRAVDQVLATYFPRPASYTGEDVVEFSGHGSPVLLRLIVAAAMTAGARLAEPGEFTLRAFLNGKLDLVQAEAVGDLVEAVTPLQARMAFDQLEGTMTTLIGELETGLFDLASRLEASIDFPEEGYHFIEPAEAAETIRLVVGRMDELLDDAGRGRLVREGIQVVILGKPNVGKSTLFNRLVGAPRAIVTEVAGTTRDLLTETTTFGGLAVTLVDTAGIRSTESVIEAEGVRRARGASAAAGVVVLMLDRSRPLAAEDTELLRDTAARRRVVVVNKMDLPGRWRVADLPGPTGVLVEVALTDGADTASLVETITNALWADDGERDTPAISNVRHVELLERARVSLGRAASSAAATASEELVLADLQDARLALEELTGKRSSDDLLNRIFERFCVGK